MLELSSVTTDIFAVQLKPTNNHHSDAN